MYPERLEELMDQYSYLNETTSQFERLNDHDRFLINLYCSNYNPRKLNIYFTFPSRAWSPIKNLCPHSLASKGSDSELRNLHVSFI